MIRTRTRIVFAAAGAASLLAACGGSGSDNADSAEKHPESAFAGLCAARAAAEDGDTAAAKKEFDHGPLHALAASAEKTDRAVAADLLENKERVETLTNKQDIDAAVLRDALDKLITATQGAQRAVGQRETVCELESD